MQKVEVESYIKGNELEKMDFYQRTFKTTQNSKKFPNTQRTFLVAIQRKLPNHTK
jgi:hypothetical protein